MSRFTRTAMLVLFAAVCGVALVGPRAAAQEPNPPTLRQRRSAAELNDLKVRYESEQQFLIDLQRKLIPLLRDDSGDPEIAAQVKNIEREIAIRSDARAKMLKRIAEAEAGTATIQLQEQLESLEAELAARSVQVQELNAQLAASEQAREAAPIDDDAVIRVYRLKFLQAAKAAETLSSIFASSSMRVAVDERANSLVVAASEHSLNTVNAVIENLDVETGEGDFDLDAVEGPDGGSAKSLMVRVYWLADGLADDEGMAPIGPLPQSVVDAVGKLGLENPRLVGQTVNSLSADGEPYYEVTFQSHVSALIFNRPAQLHCFGKISPFGDGRIDLGMKLDASGDFINTEMSGSLTVPLGHYMVLGTANSVVDVSSDEERQARLKILRAQQRAAELEERGRRGDGGVAPPAEVPDPKYAMSHFAFVVQVVRGESFQGDE